MELIYRPVLNNEVLYGTTVVGPDVQSQHQSGGIRAEEGSRRWDSRGLALSSN